MVSTHLIKNAPLCNTSSQVGTYLLMLSFTLAGCSEDRQEFSPAVSVSCGFRQKQVLSSKSKKKKRERKSQDDNE